MGTPVVPLGHPRLAMFLKSIAFVKGPTSAEALCGMSGGVCILSLGWGKESGSVLFWSWPGEQGGDLLCGAEDLSCLHGCAFRAVFPLGHSVAYQPASPLYRACAAPAVPVSFGLG